MAGFRIEGDASGVVAEVDSDKNIFVRTPGYGAGGQVVGGGPENSMVLDLYYRLR